MGSPVAGSAAIRCSNNASVQVHIAKITTVDGPCLEENSSTGKLDYFVQQSIVTTNTLGPDIPVVLFTNPTKVTDPLATFVGGGYFKPAGAAPCILFAAGSGGVTTLHVYGSTLVTTPGLSPPAFCIVNLSTTNPIPIVFQSTSATEPNDPNTTAIPMAALMTDPAVA